MNEIPQHPDSPRPRKPTVMVDVENVTFTYRGAEQPALDGIRLRQLEGQLVVVMGPSGAGKSTLCRCINGLVPRYGKGDFRGDVRVENASIAPRAVSDVARTVGLVFQDFEAQLVASTVEAEIVFGLENLCVPPDQMSDRVSECLEFVGLAGMARREVGSLSGGEKQRLALAAVLALGPRVLVLDEPTTDLDPAGKNEVFFVAAKLTKVGMTLLMVEHEPEAARRADQIIVMNDGRIVMEGDPQTVFRRSGELAKLGVRPLDIAALFAGADDEEPLPLTVEEGVRRARHEGWSLAPARIRDRLEAETRRASQYGDDAISLEGVSFSYDIGTALRDVSLTVRRGECVAIAGQNGCGKTTLAKLVNGLLLPDRGTVRVFGKPTIDMTIAEIGRHVGLVFQNPDNQIFAERVLDEVRFGPANLGRLDEHITKDVAEALQAVGLTGYEDADPFSLTKGERQRVAVAGVLATRPKVIILDEPTTGLDYRQQRDMMELIRRLNESGHTIIMITHAMWVIAEYAHRCIVLKEGRILADGPVREVFRQEDLLKTADLVPPDIVRFSNRLGFTLLSRDEVEACMVCAEPETAPS